MLGGLLLATRGAHPAIIELRRVERMPVGQGRQHGRRLEKEVVYRPTLHAVEMTVEGGVTIETRLARVDGELCHCPLLNQEGQRVVDGCFRKGRDLRSQGSVNLVGRRVGTVGSQVVQYRHPLEGGSDAVLFEQRGCIGEGLHRFLY